MSELDTLRKEIDEIDLELLPLLIRRFETAIKVADFKSTHDIPVLNSAREKEILDKIAETVTEFSSPIKMVYSIIMDVSREIQSERIGHVDQFLQDIALNKNEDAKEKNAPVIACQGISGAYSVEAAKKLYPEGNLIFFETFEEVFESVKSGNADYLVVPVENSSAGSVNEIYDLILKHRFYINKGIEMPINHCLLGLEGAKLSGIKTVYSHPQGLLQCSKYLKEHAFESVPYANTALAAKMVAESRDLSKAAIASEISGKEFGLKVLAENIQNLKDNSTRFFSISRKLTISERSNKISLCFSLPHTTGSLYRILARFAALGLNLTKIESRPNLNKAYEYCFYLDFSGNVNDEKILKFLSALSNELPDFSFLGNYTEF